MNILRLSFAALVIYLYCLQHTDQQEAHNVTEWTKSRQKRTVLFTTLGVHKFIISLALPVFLNPGKPWGTMYGAWNFQWQHLLPTTIQYWWNSTYWPQAGRKRSIGEANLPTFHAQQPVDLTATFLYAIIETYMNNKGQNGRECLKRAICENAQVHFVGGILDRIYQRLLTPEPSMDDYYKDSFESGSQGVDCYKTYSECPRGESLFDKFVKVEEVKDE